MQVKSCSILLCDHSADPVMSLDLGTDSAVTAASGVSVYKRERNVTNLSKTIPRDAELESFLRQIACVVDSVCTAVTAANASSTSAKGQFCYYGKGSFLPEPGGPRLMRFRYRRGSPPGPRAPPGQLWNETWTSEAMRDCPDVIELSTRDIPDLAEYGEPRLCGDFLASKANDCTEAHGALFHRVCFGCRAVGPAAARVICWLHPEWSSPASAPVNDSQEQQQQSPLPQPSQLQSKRLKQAVQNNYICVLERMGDIEADSSQRASLFFLAVESGSFAAADWLMSGPGGGCGVDVIDRSGDTALARCCSRGGDPAKSTLDFLLRRGADRRRLDAEGNSALHRLAAALRPLDKAAEVGPAMLALAGDLTPRQLADWLAVENSAGERPMALLTSPAAVDWLLGRLLLPTEKADGAVSASEIPGLLSCANGFSLVHSVAAFGSLRDAEKVVSERLDASAWQRLLGAAVESGRLRGYTAMHAACQRGSWENVRYLMLRGCPPPTAGALDLAIREGQLVDYPGQFFSFVNAVLLGSPENARKTPWEAVAAALRILDPAEHCLTLARRSPAGRDDDDDDGDCESPTVAAADFRLHLASSRVPDDAGRDPLIDELTKAFRQDSVESLRSLAVCYQPPGDFLVSCERPEQLRKLADKVAASDYSYSGLLGMALHLRNWRLAGHLLQARQFDLLPACLGVMLIMREKIHRAKCKSKGEKHLELMDDLYQLARRTFCCAMQRLHRGAVTEAQRGLVLNYLGGRFHPQSAPEHGPLFPAHPDKHDGPCHSVFDMMMLTSEPELLALPCAANFVDRQMSSPISQCCFQCSSDAPTCGWSLMNQLSELWTNVDLLRRRLPGGITPKGIMMVTLVFNLVFVCLLGYYVHEFGTQEPPAKQMALKVLLLLCGLSYAAQELQDVCSIPSGSGRLCHRLTRYAANKWNLVDIAAVVLLLVGLIWAFALESKPGISMDTLGFYFARLILAVSFVLYCLRMLSSLGYFERLGLYISITKTTFVMDVVPFLIVNAFFLVSFGFLIICLLFPGGKTYPSGQSYAGATSTASLNSSMFLTEMLQRPLLAHFGEFGMDKLRSCQQSASETACPHPLGNDLYSRAVLFIYLLIVSVVLINVLIAKLSLTVSREDERARVIWRTFRVKLLHEFRGATSAPPLLRAGLWAVGACRRLIKGGCRRSADAPAAAGPASATAHSQTQSVEMGQTNVKAWWLSPNSQFPEDYMKFLWLQAMQFRNARHSFSR